MNIVSVENDTYWRHDSGKVYKACFVVNQWGEETEKSVICYALFAESMIVPHDLIAVPATVFSTEFTHITIEEVIATAPIRQELFAEIETTLGSELCAFLVTRIKNIHIGATRRWASLEPCNHAAKRTQQFIDEALNVIKLHLSIGKVKINFTYTIEVKYNPTDNTIELVPSQTIDELTKSIIADVKKADILNNTGIIEHVDEEIKYRVKRGRILSDWSYRVFDDLFHCISRANQASRVAAEGRSFHRMDDLTIISC